MEPLHVARLWAQPQMQGLRARSRTAQPTEIACDRDDDCECKCQFSTRLPCVTVVRCWGYLTQVCAMHVCALVTTLLSCRVGQSYIYIYIYMVFIRCFWKKNYQIFGHIRCIYTILANLTLLAILMVLHIILTA